MKKKAYMMLLRSTSISLIGGWLFQQYQTDQLLTTVESYALEAEQHTMKGDYDQAIEYHKKVLPLQIQLHGANSGHVGGVYLKLIELYEKQGNHKKAIECWEQVREIATEMYGERSTQVGKVCMKLSKLYEKQGNYKKAVECCEKALITTDIRKG